MPCILPTFSSLRSLSRSGYLFSITYRLYIIFLTSSSHHTVKYYHGMDKTLCCKKKSIQTDMSKQRWQLSYYHYICCEFNRNMWIQPVVKSKPVLKLYSMVKSLNSESNVTVSNQWSLVHVWDWKWAKYTVSCRPTSCIAQSNSEATVLKTCALFSSNDTHQFEARYKSSYMKAYNLQIWLVLHNKDKSENITMYCPTNKYCTEIWCSNKTFWSTFPSSHQQNRIHTKASTHSFIRF